MAEDRKVKALHTMLEDEIAEIYDHWNDLQFTQQIEERSEEYKSGKVIGVSWEAARTNILRSCHNY